MYPSSIFIWDCFFSKSTSERLPGDGASLDDFDEDDGLDGLDDEGGEDGMSVLYFLIIELFIKPFELYYYLSSLPF